MRAAALICILLLLPAILRAQEGGDVQAQILYAYQTEDTNTLVNLIQDLAAKLKDAPGDATLSYHLAHANYRMGQLAGRAQSHRAEQSFSDCIDELKPLLQKDVKSVETLILQGACYQQLADLKSVEAVVLRGRAGDRLNAAAKLAPKNPRLLLVSSTEELARAKVGSPQRQQALSQLNLAAQIFDTASGTSVDEPGWGHSEAYLALGKEAQARGDRVQARNLFEKALIAAPDFKAAQRQLAMLAKP
jgi:tetratricopeptide (TPR) repeat protein